MNKKTVLIVLLLCPFLLFAETISSPQTLDEIIKDAYAHSNQITELKINEQNYALEKEIEDSAKADQTYYELGLGSSSLTGNSFTFYATPYANLTYENIEEDYSIVVGTTSYVGKNVSLANSVTPSVEYQKKFNLGYDIDVNTDLANATQNFVTEKNFKLNYLQFENSLTTDLQSILQSQKALNTSLKNLETMKEDLSNQIKLKEININSVQYLKNQLAISDQEISISGQKKQLEEAKEQFVEDYGIEVPNNLIIICPIVEYEPKADGNYSVKESAYNLSLAKEKVKSLTSEVKSIGFNANAGAAISKTSTVPTVALSGSYNSDNLNLSATGQVSYSAIKEFEPSLTLAGSYTNKIEKTSLDTIKLSEAKNDELKAQMAYDEALRNYQKKAKTLVSDIEDWNTKLTQLANRKAYDKQVLEQTQTMYNKGFTTIKEVEEAETTLENDAFNEKILYINGRILQLRIAEIEL